jgi:hypothetical protein
LEKSRPARQRLVIKSQQTKLTDLTPSLPRGDADPLKEFMNRVINPRHQKMAEQFDAEMRKLIWPNK